MAPASSRVQCLAYFDNPQVVTLEEERKQLASVRIGCGREGSRAVAIYGRDEFPTEEVPPVGDPAVPLSLSAHPSLLIG